MKESVIREAINDYLEQENPVKKEMLFNKTIYPYIDKILDGVMFNFNIYKDNNDIDIDIDDLKQEAYIKVLSKIFDKECLVKIQSLKNYIFIVARNKIVDQIRKSNTNRHYLNLLIDDDLCEYNIYKELLG